MVFIAWGNLFDRIRTTCSGERTRKCDSIPNWIHLMYKPRLKENSKKQALWQFKSYRIEVLSNTGNRNTGLQGTFRGSSSLQIKSDLKEPRWLLTSIPQKPTAAFNHPNQHVGIRQHRHPCDKGFICRSWPILSPHRGVFSSSFLLDKTVTNTHALNHHAPQT